LVSTRVSRRRDGINETYDLGATQIGALETLENAGIRCLCLLQRGRVSDISQGGLDLLFPIGAVETKTGQALPSQFNVVSPNGVPRGFWSEIGSDEEGNRPDPLEDERKSPAEISVDAGHGSDNAGREQDAGAPAHADVRCDVGSEDGGNDLTGIGG